jgi:hypothetical protein
MASLLFTDNLCCITSNADCIYRQSYDVAYLAPLQELAKRISFCYSICHNGTNCEIFYSCFYLKMCVLCLLVHIMHTCGYLCMADETQSIVVQIPQRGWNTWPYVILKASVRTKIYHLRFLNLKIFLPCYIAYILYEKRLIKPSSLAHEVNQFQFNPAKFLERAVDVKLCQRCNDDK